jgi:hypothetical protein
MATRTVHYIDFGIRTRNGAYWVMIVMALAAIDMVILEYVRTHDVVRLVTASIWIFGIVLGTARNLRRLGELERDHPEPTAAMKLAFELTLVLPIAGMVPLVAL